MDKLAQSFDKMSERLDTLESNGGPRSLDQDRVMHHMRRYAPFYALATFFLLMILILPTRTPGQQQASSAGQVTSAGTDGSFDGTAATDSSTSSGVNVSGSTRTVRNNVGGSNYVPQPGDVPGQVTVPDAVRELNPMAWKATGTTRGGFHCGPGIRQLPWSRYTVPCYPKYSGPNGGATARGVTGSKVVVVNRTFPPDAASQAVDAFVQQAGFASSDEFTESRHKFVDYFNKVFEMWGRKVEFIEYKSEYGDSTTEALGGGKEGACQDADSILGKYKPMIVLSGSAVFGECAAVRKMTAFGPGAYYPEWWYKKYHPYLWGGVMECERIAHQNAEYLGKRVFHHKSKWAKQLEKNKDRKIGLIVPTNDEYQSCVKISAKDLKTQYNAAVTSQYNYQLDISRFADEAQRAIVQFHAAHVTTIFLACDPLIPIFLTQDATNQGFFPEWISNGAGLTDVDQFARLWDQTQIQGSLFGMSQLGDNERILGPKGEGTVTYKKATGQTIPPGTQTEYYAMLRLFGALQGAGPVLTPETIANGFWHAPPGGAPEFEVGYTSYLDGSDGTPGAHDHTAVDDQREIYWVCTSFSGDAKGTSRCSEPKGYDGKGGIYRTTYGGKRFRNGEWPREEPPIYKHGNY